MKKCFLYTLCTMSLVISAGIYITPIIAAEDDHFFTDIVNIQYDPSMAKCTDISYCDKKTRFGKEYFRYVVKCSDGKKREITAWDNRTKWCVGMSNDCYSTQREAADAACKK